MTQEIFRPIKGYEGCYEVSNKGNVKSLSRLKKCVRYGKPYYVKLKEMILKPYVDFKGYLRVDLNKDGKREAKKVHRLVAEAFIGDIYNKEIDHINTIKTDNRVENLKIVTSKENCNNPISKERMRKGHFKKVRCITQDGNIFNFNSIREAEQKGFGRNYGISQCLHGRIKTHNNNRWEYIN